MKSCCMLDGGTTKCVFCYRLTEINTYNQLAYQCTSKTFRVYRTPHHKQLEQIGRLLIHTATNRGDAYLLPFLPSHQSQLVIANINLGQKNKKENGVLLNVFPSYVPPFMHMEPFIFISKGILGHLSILPILQI